MGGSRRSFWLLRAAPSKLAGALSLALVTTASAEPPLIQVSAIASQPSAAPLPILKSGNDLEGTSLHQLRRDASDVRPPTTRKLVGLSQHKVILGDPQRSLAIVRALANHEQKTPLTSPLKSPIIRALAVFFQGNATRDAVEPEVKTLRHVVRGTAAMALARSQHPEAMRLLVAESLNHEQSPIISRMARNALRRFARHLRSNDVAPLFSGNDLKRALRQPVTAELPETPLKLVELPKYQSLPPQEAVQLSLPAALAQIRKARRLPHSYRSRRAWNLAHDQAPTWTLRALAVLLPILPSQLIREAQTLAVRSSNSAKASEAHAAKWLLKTLSPPPSTLEPLLSGKHDDTPASLALMPLHERQLWNELSNLQLRKLEITHPHPNVTTLLSARVRSGSSGRGPELETVRRWLMANNDERIRSGVARGLGMSPNQAASALLFRAYRSEPSVTVRRAIVTALFRRGLVSEAFLQELLNLDPDPGCYARGHGSVDPEASGFYWGQSERGLATISDREGREFGLKPAPDGFVGLTSPTL